MLGSWWNDNISCNFIYSLNFLNLYEFLTFLKFLIFLYQAYSICLVNDGVKEITVVRKMIDVWLYERVFCFFFLKRSFSISWTLLLKHTKSSFCLHCRLQNSQGSLIGAQVWEEVCGELSLHHEMQPRPVDCGLGGALCCICYIPGRVCPTCTFLPSLKKSFWLHLILACIYWVYTSWELVASRWQGTGAGEAFGTNSLLPVIKCIVHFGYHPWREGTESVANGVTCTRNRVCG